MRPWLARFRKQIRQMPNLRYTARARPQILHRSWMRILSLGRILTLSGWRLLASSFASCRRNFTFLASVVINLLFLAERHAERAEQFPRFVVAICAGNKRHVHALGERDLIRIYLRKHHLLGEAKAVVAVAVKTLGIHAAEVPDTRQGHTDQPVQEFVHPSAAERHPAADLIPLAEPETTHRLFGLRYLGPLAGNLGELIGRLLHPVLVL